MARFGVSGIENITAMFSLRHSLSEFISLYNIVKVFYDICILSVHLCLSSSFSCCVFFSNLYPNPRSFSAMFGFCPSYS